MANFTTDGKICIERDLDEPQERIQIEDLREYFEIQQTCKWIAENNYVKVCLQFPDDLLSFSAKIYYEIKQIINVDLYVLGDTSYGSCCVDSVAAMHVEGDAIVHYGHACFTKTNIPVYYVLPKKQLNISKAFEAVSKQFGQDNDNKLCLLYGAEFEFIKDVVANNWFQLYPNSYIGYIHIEENVHRCLGRIVKNRNGDDINLNVLKECVCIYLGSNGQTLFNFTVSIEAHKWYLLNADIFELNHMQETSWFKRRHFFIEKCKDANTVGILVCKLAGDQTKKIISRIKQLCKVNGKKNYIVSVGKPNVAKLANFPEIDIYVMVACPENDLYNSRDFYKPIVYPFELEVALNSNREAYFTQHITDYDELLQGKRHHFEIGDVEESTDVSLVTGRIRETKIGSSVSASNELVGKKNWALESIGQNLQDRSWRGLEQKLGETGVMMADQGRSGIPLQYKNEPN